MTVKSGFFNSNNGDRKYNALDVSSMFDGVIEDGVFENIGEFLATVPGDGMQVIVKTGRAWFDHTWIVNDENLPLSISPSDSDFTRIDTVVIEVNQTLTVRNNTIKVVTGTPSANPVKPSLTKTSLIHQYPIAYITVLAGMTAIKSTVIDVCVGRSECPFVLGPLLSESFDQLYENWDTQFNTWFDDLRQQMTDDVVTNIQYQIDQIRRLNYDVPDQVLKKWGFTPSEVQDKNIASIFARLFVPNLKTKTLIFTESGVWTNLDGATQVTLRMFGGGSGGSNGAGGGGGHMYYGTITLPSNLNSITYTIGNGGSSGNAGGTTSFGTLASANGGNGASGGTGGGGGGSSVAGGNGSYGGGGGGAGGHAGCPDTSAGNRGASSPGSGGTGGTYGGGGGGGGGAPGYGNAAPPGASGGTARYGAGGKGGGAGDAASYASSGSSGVNTNSLDVEFKGPGSSGISGSNVAAGGGGGGGYGGNGGHGGNGGTSVLWESHRGGGGGGGYGGNGGNGGTPALGANWHDAGGGGGGGGGGYGSAGGNGGNGTEGYKAGSTGAGGGGGGYGVSGKGADASGGSGAGTAGGGAGGYAGGKGIIIMTYSYYEYEFGAPGGAS